MSIPPRPLETVLDSSPWKAFRELSVLYELTSRLRSAGLPSPSLRNVGLQDFSDVLLVSFIPHAF